MTPKPRSYPQNDVQNYKNFTNTCSYEVLSSLFDRYRATLRYRYLVLIQNIAEVMTPKPRFHPENNVQNYKNFTNICLYEVLSSERENSCSYCLSASGCLLMRIKALTIMIIILIRNW